MEKIDKSDDKKALKPKPQGKPKKGNFHAMRAAIDPKLKEEWTT